MNPSARTFIYFVGLALLSIGVGLSLGAGNGVSCFGAGVIVYAIVGRRG